MALRGNLKDFSLPDVFQLVTFSRKTGVLRIKREDGAEGSVWFRDGDVFFASSNWHADPLGERLVRAQRITPQALGRALELRAVEEEGGRRLGQILMDEGYITDKVLESFVSEQIQDTIFDLMRWDEGEFDFEAMPEVVDEDIGLTVSIENVVMEGSRRLEEWSRIKKKIPSMDVVFKMATAPGEGTFEISLKPMEWQLLLLIDATRSVAELATETNRTDFEVARILYGLFSAGLLEFATEEEIEHNRAERAAREAKLAEIEAEQRAADELAQKAALQREAKLAAEAEKRRAAEAAESAGVAESQAQVAAEAADAAAIEAMRAARTEPEEEPEFLGGATVAPTADDQSVLEEFMGAVLQRPAQPEAAPAAPEPAPPVAPYVPAEEPAFMGIAAQDEDELPLVAVPSIEDLLTGIAPEPVAEQPAVPEPVAEQPPVPEPIAEELAAELEPPTPAMPAVEAEPEATAVEKLPEQDRESAFERDLMALGLGEMPSDLLEPVEAEIPAPDLSGEGIGAPAAPVAEPAGEPALVDEFEVVAEPMSEAAWIETVPEPTDEPELVLMPGEPGEELSAEALADEFAALGESLELPTEVPTEPMMAEEPAEAEPDFSALLESLDVDAGAGPSVPEEVPLEEAGFDADLLRDETPLETGGVISTDAFLEDISIDDLGFSGGLNDELSALTGAERKGPSRPQASVNAIPEAGENVLQRDMRVDKDTLLKIIDGIKNL